MKFEFNWPSGFWGNYVLMCWWDSNISGRVRASPASLHGGPWARHIYPSFVLVQPRKTRPCLTERLLMGRKESNQTKTPIWATLVEKLKVNLDLWNLFTAIIALGLTYQVRIMTLASTVLKKSTFQKNSHLNALGSKLTLTLSRSRST